MRMLHTKIQRLLTKVLGPLGRVVLLPILKVPVARQRWGLGANFLKRTDYSQFLLFLLYVT